MLVLLGLSAVGQEPGVSGIDPGLEQGLDVLDLKARSDLVVHQFQDVVLGQIKEAPSVHSL